ncbi:MAG: glutamate formimidoyltransferase [Candidatus Cloacimonas sp.]|nr:glutamate formimidoyltransferase [Candidatus Cloacimonadota bacterium]
MKLLECVPNFSEGRDKGVLEAIAQEIRKVKNVTLLDVDPGADTNRTVFTFVGEPEGVVEAAFQAIKKASELIDMSQHKGAHARMGATDVCPLIPVSGVTVEEAVAYSNILAERVGNELKIPVYLYEHSATKEEWRNLAEIRKGEYEALPEKMKDPYWKPNYGPFEFNEKSGATVIGAREFLIAYNINLNTRDTRKASFIANRIREKGYVKRDENGKIVRDEQGNRVMNPGFFSHCKAIGWFIDEYDRAQISMNLTNYKITPPHLVLEKVRELAAEKGVVVTGSELVGLIPKEAMLVAGRYYLEKLGESGGIPERKVIETAIQSMGLAELSPFEIDKKIIEYSIESKDNLVNLSLKDFTDLLSTDSPAPGGGSIAALNAAVSGALTSMVANLTFGKKGYETGWEEAKEIAVKAQSLKDRALAGIDKDTDSFNNLMAAMRLPRKTDEEKAIREAKIQETTKQAILVPLETLEMSLEAVELSKQVFRIGNKNAISDAGVAAIMATAAAKSSYFNVQINMPGITDETFREEVLTKAKRMLEKVCTLSEEVEKGLHDLY